MGLLRRLFRIVLAVVSLAGALAFAPHGAHAEKRIALVIGNSEYRHVARLDNPANDARLIAATLRDLGFTLVGGGPRLDLDKAGFDRAVQEFGSALAGADVGLFYYAGHGVQVRGANYLVPVGANPAKEADVDFQMLDANLVLRQMEGAGTRLNLVILDACRNNPFGGRGLRSASNGLAQMQAPEGTLISFATQPGNVALDGSGRNSPYTLALAQTIRKPGLGLFDAFNAVGLAVKQATGGAQQPWVSSSPIGGSFFFAGRPAGGQPSAPAQPAPAAPALAADEVFWLTIKDSKVAALFEEFLNRFPSSRNAGDARTRLEELKRSQPSVAVQSPAPQPGQPAPAQGAPARKHELKVLEAKLSDKTIHAMVGEAGIASGGGRCFAYIPVDVPGGKIFLYISDYVKPNGSKEYSEISLVFERIRVKTATIVSAGRSFRMYVQNDGAWVLDLAEHPDLLARLTSGAATEILVDSATAQTIRRSVDTSALQQAAENRNRFCRV
jgi:uncharacterized caspase-like protein